MTRAARRSYHQFCGVAKALDILGERWTLLIARDLLLGPRRYSDLLDGLPGITTNLLARRLQDMLSAGLVQKRRLPPPASATVYDLTDRGWQLEPIVLALGKWGWHYMQAPLEAEIVNVDWAMVAIKRRYVPTGVRWTAELRPGGKVFQLRPAGPRLEVRFGAPWEPDLIVSGGADDFRALFFADARPAALVDGGRLVVEGPSESWAAFLAALGLQP